VADVCVWAPAGDALFSNLGEKVESCWECLVFVCERGACLRAASNGMWQRKQILNQISCPSLVSPLLFLRYARRVEFWWCHRRRCCCSASFMVIAHKRPNLISETPRWEKDKTCWVCVLIHAQQSETISCDSALEVCSQEYSFDVVGGPLLSAKCSPNKIMRLDQKILFNQPSQRRVIKLLCFITLFQILTKNALSLNNKMFPRIDHI